MLLRVHEYLNPPPHGRGFLADHRDGTITLTRNGAIIAHFARSTALPRIARLSPSPGAGTPYHVASVPAKEEIEQADTARGGLLWELPTLGEGVYCLSHWAYTIYFEVVCLPDYPAAAYVSWLSDERARAVLRTHELAKPTATPLADRIAAGGKQGG